MHAEMSELLDKQVYVLNECFKYKFRDSRRGSHKPTKCAMKIKERKKRWPSKNFFDDRKDFVWLYQKSDVTDFDDLQVNSSSHTKGTICLVDRRMGTKGWFFEHGRTNGVIKLVMGWYLGLGLSDCMNFNITIIVIKTSRFRLYPIFKNNQKTQVYCSKTKLKSSFYASFSIFMHLCFGLRLFLTLYF